MTLQKTNIGTHPQTGSPWFHYGDPSGEQHVLITGPVSGKIFMSDGTEVDVNDDVISFNSQAEALEAAHHIGMKHERDGHPQKENFIHVCSPHCGELRRSAEEVAAAYEAKVDVTEPDHQANLAILMEQYNHVGLVS